MLKGQYTRTELGVKRGNIQWKAKVNNETLLFVNEGMDNKPGSNYIYSNHLDREEDVLYMCRDSKGGWSKKFLKDIKDTNVRIFYRDNKKPIWSEFIYSEIIEMENGFKAIGDLTNDEIGGFDNMKDNTYIFICNNDKWNFFENVKNEGRIESWKCTKSVKLGDKFYIHLGGNSIEEKGIIAKGTVVSEPYIDMEEDHLVADLQIEKIFDKPVLKFKQGMHQVQGSCARARVEIIEEIENAVSLAENI